MSQPYSDKVYETYHADTYAARNDLTEQGLAKASKAYERSFGPLLPKDRSAPILEIGCGVGAFLESLVNMGYNDWRGIDISPDQIDFCRTRGISNVQVADGLAYLKSSKSRFGAIVMSDVLEHLEKAAVLEILEAISERLEPGGRLLLRVPNLSNPLNVRTRYVDFTHEVGFTKESLAQVLRVSGYETVSIHGEFSLHRRYLARLVFDQVSWWVFRMIHRHTLHLKAEVVRGKNLIAVATPLT